MNLVKNPIQSILHAHGFAFGVFVTLFAFFFFAGGLVVANGQTLTPSDSHVVNLYIDGVESSAPTRAATVGDFITKANIKLNEGDVTEPILASPIDEDGFRVQIFRAKPVTIVDGQTITRILTPQKSAQLIVAKAGLTVYPEDTLTLTTTDNFVKSTIFGEKLIIDRATPVTISLYGTPAATYRTHATTVGNLLKEKGIVPEQGATVSPDVNTPLNPSTAIFISKFGKSVITVDEPIAYGVESSNDASKTIGTTTIITAGVNGKKQVIYELSLRDGKEIGRTVIQEVVTSQPQTQVQTKGTKMPVVVEGDRIAWMAAAGISESDYYYVDFIVGHEGAWNGTTKWNKAGSGAYGLCQALPATKMASAGADYMTNPITQLRWCSGYAVGRYGSWAAAYSFWQINHYW